MQQNIFYIIAKLSSVAVILHVAEKLWDSTQQLVAAEVKAHAFITQETELLCYWCLAMEPKGTIILCI